jgi:transposase
MLNRIPHYVGFVYPEIRFPEKGGRGCRIEIRLEAHRGMQGRCSQCGQPTPGYDRLEERRWDHVPRWGIPVDFFYAPRRVNGPAHGVGVEHLPWNEGKRTLTTARMGFLARGGRRRSWRETAEVFPVSGEAVYRSVQGFVEWGGAHRERKGLESMGWDEIHGGRGRRARNFLTVVYQLDRPGRRWW